MARKGRKNVNAVKTEVDGIKFDSKFEASRYEELKVMQEEGEIFQLRCHVPFLLQDEEAGIYIRELRGKKVRTYTPDFIYLVVAGEGATHYFRSIAEDTKGRTTPAASLRMSVFRALYPDIEHRVIKPPKRKKKKG